MICIGRSHAHAYVILFAVLLAGCAAKDTAEPPAELVKLNPEKTIQRVWKQSTGKGTDVYRLSLRPHFSQEGIAYSIDYQGLIAATRLSDGKTLWEKKTQHQVSGGLGATADLLIYGTNDGELIAVKQKDGAEVWRTVLSSVMLSVPAYDSGMLIVRTLDGNVQGYIANNGEKSWGYKLSVPKLTLHGNSDPLPLGGVVMIGTDSGRMLGLTVDDGRVLFNTPVAISDGANDLDKMIDVDTAPVLVGDTLYIAAFQGRVAAFNLKQQGQVEWVREKSTFQHLAVDEQHVYMTDERSHIWALDRKTGSTVWVQDNLNARKVSAPLSFGAYIVVADFEGYLHLISKTDGRFVGRRKTHKSGYLTEPLLGSERFYLLNKNGDFAAYSIKALPRLANDQAVEN